jgi:hypothetical protein
MRNIATLTRERGATEQKSRLRWIVILEVRSSVGSVPHGVIPPGLVLGVHEAEEMV